MKRIGYLKDKICNIDNIYTADDNARKNKKKKYGIEKHDENRDYENNKLLNDIKDLKYKTSNYSTFKIYEPKERLIYRLPYYPDRITHHAIMNIMEPIWKNIFIKNTYSSIKGRGIHKCAKDLKKALQNDIEGTKYCLKLDIRKFYPSIDHDILFQIIKKKIKDEWLLQLLKEIIDSAPGVPIGNYLSQFFANLYLTYFDHWIKEELKCKYYFRYADDIIVLSDNKSKLRSILIAIKFYIHKLRLEIKQNYQIFPVESRGVDFIGYVFRHKYTLLRKSIKHRIIKLVDKYSNRKINKNTFESKMTSYRGWLKYCDSKNFSNIIYIKTNYKISTFCGNDYKISKLNKLYVIEIIDHNKYFELHSIKNKRPINVVSTNKKLRYNLKKFDFPFYYKL